MEILKTILLLLAYSLGIATLIVQLICYLKDLEYKESIFFSVAFLLLIVASTFKSIFKIVDPGLIEIQEVATILLTVVFSVSIPINIHKERVDNSRKIRNLIVVIIGLIVAVCAFLAHSFIHPVLVDIIIFFHLFLSVIYSMFFILFTKPGLLIEFREKSERIVAVIVLAIMIITFIFLIANIKRDPFMLMEQYDGIILAIICIFLSISKIPGDIKKLLHIDAVIQSGEIKTDILGITQREQEVLQLLITGKTYKEIAAELFISLPTVKTHVSNIYSKAQVRNRLELSNLVKHLSTGD